MVAVSIAVAAIVDIAEVVVAATVAEAEVAAVAVQAEVVVNISMNQQCWRQLGCLPMNEEHTKKFRQMKQRTIRPKFVPATAKVLPLRAPLLDRELMNSVIVFPEYL